MQVAPKIFYLHLREIFSVVDQLHTAILAKDSIDPSIAAGVIEETLAFHTPVGAKPVKHILILKIDPA